MLDVSEKDLKKDFNKHTHRDAVLASGMSLQAKMVCISIGNRCNNSRPFKDTPGANSLSSWIGIDTIRKESGIKSRTTVTKALKEARDAGFLVFQERQGTSHMFMLWFGFNERWNEIVGEAPNQEMVGGRPGDGRVEEGPNQEMVDPRPGDGYEHGKGTLEVKKNTVMEQPRAFGTEPGGLWEEDVQEEVGSALADLDWNPGRVLALTA